MNEHKIHFFYIIPSDTKNRAEEAIRQAALHIRAWNHWQMGNDKTFTLADPIVKVCNSVHPASWFSQHDPFSGPELPKHLTFFPSRGDNRTLATRAGLSPQDSSGWYWLNSLAEAYSFGASWTDGNSYVCYVDAPIGANQYAGGTTSGYSGIAVLHGKDVNAVMGLDPDWTRCRAIGGHCHELLHTTGRPHPPPGPDFGRAVMGTGYMVYPDCVLLDADKEALNQNPLFTPTTRALAPAGLCPFPGSNITPRPAPVPHRR